MHYTTESRIASRIANWVSPPFILAMFILCLFYLISCGNDPKKNDEPLEAFENIKPGTETPKGIAPIKLSDTTGKDMLGIDSVKITIAFQLAANELSMAYVNKDANTYAKYTPESIIKRKGGKLSYVQSLNNYFQSGDMPYFKILSGPIQRTLPKLDDQGYGNGWYCLMPVKMYRKSQSGEVLQDLKWMGGQTLDEGKNIYFIDITNMTPEKINQIMPDLRVVLVK